MKTPLIIHATRREVTLEKWGYGTIIVPKGIRLTHRTALGEDKAYDFVDEFEWIKEHYPGVQRILTYDAKYKGLNIPKEHVLDLTINTVEELRALPADVFNDVIEIAGIDLLENFHLLPQEVQDILETGSDEGDLYEECRRIIALIEEHGYTADYDLSGTLFDLKKLPPKE